MNNVGYEICEPEIFGEWLATVKNRSILVPFLTWILGRVDDELKDKFPELNIEIIKVEYSGIYPAIGIRNDDNIPENAIKILESLLEEILRTASVYDFVDFVFKDDTDWNDVAQRLLD